MVEERDGWFVVNVRDAKWKANPAFGKYCIFEGEGKFTQTGVGLALLEPGKSNCRYHREEAQEDFLVLMGECLLLVNGEKKRLKAWDFVHCPPGVSHVFVGVEGPPCAIVMIGHRPAEKRLWYPENELARRHGAEAPQPTAEPKVAYSDVPSWKDTVAPDWPVES